MAAWPLEALVVHVVVSKFCDSLPLYRQSQMLARQGIALDRSTLSNWVGRASSWWLTPLYELVLNTVLSSSKRCLPMTRRCRVLDPGRGRTKTGHLWCYAVDERAFGSRRGAPSGSLCVFRGPQERATCRTPGQLQRRAPGGRL